MNQPQQLKLDGFKDIEPIEKIEDYSSTDENNEPELDENCPNCGHEYDEIDYDYQICHYCKYDNSK